MGSQIQIGGGWERVLLVAKSRRYLNYFELAILVFITFTIIYHGSKKNSRLLSPHLGVI